MHPFSLNKTEQKSVTGGVSLKPIYITLGLEESGDAITLAFPEDGSTPWQPM